MSPDCSCLNNYSYIQLIFFCLHTYIWVLRSNLTAWQNLPRLNCCKVSRNPQNRKWKPLALRDLSREFWVLTGLLQIELGAYTSSVVQKYYFKTGALAFSYCVCVFSWAVPFRVLSSPSSGNRVLFLRCCLAVGTKVVFPIIGNVLWWHTVQCKLFLIELLLVFYNSCFLES